MNVSEFMGDYRNVSRTRSKDAKEEGRIIGLAGCAIALAELNEVIACSTIRLFSSIGVPSSVSQFCH